EQERCESESVVEIPSQGEQPRSSSESTVEIPSQGAPGKSSSGLEGARNVPWRTVVPVISLLKLTLGELVWYIGTSLTSCLPTRSTMPKNESGTEGIAGWENLGTYTILTEPTLNPASTSTGRSVGKLRRRVDDSKPVQGFQVLLVRARPWWKHLATKTRAIATKKLPVPRIYWDISGVPCPVESSITDGAGVGSAKVVAIDGIGDMIVQWQPS
ncbi:hypothetical protein L210DRAFT_3521654, partial [Boletus edulis BED1]